MGFGARREGLGSTFSGLNFNCFCNVMLLFTLLFKFPLFLPQKPIFVAFVAPLGSPTPRKTSKTILCLTVFRKNNFYLPGSFLSPFLYPFGSFWVLLGLQVVQKVQFWTSISYHKSPKMRAKNPLSLKFTKQILKIY